MLLVSEAGTEITIMVEQPVVTSRWCFGETPIQTYFDALSLVKENIVAA
jgi:hypothetical protein